MHPTKWPVPANQLLFSLGAGLLVEACYSFGYQVDSIPCTTELGSNFWNPTKWLGLLGYQKASLSGGLEYPNFDCNFLSAKCMMVMFFKSLSGQPGKSQIDLLYWRFLIHLMSGLSLHVGQNSSVCKQRLWIVLSHYVEEGKYQEMEQTNKLGTWGVYNHRYSLQIIVRCFFTLMILIWLSLRMTDSLVGSLLDDMKLDWCCASCLES